MIRNFLLVGLGGMIGSMLRYGTFLSIRNQSFPYSTFFVNIAGSFIIGIIAGLMIKNTGFTNEWRLFLATGICGGFTTFSAWSVESLQLLQQHRYGTATVYIIASMAFGIAAAFGGWVLSK